MARQNLTRHQEKIVKRYYEHQETIQTTRLGDLVSELWLAEDQKTRTRLWGKAQVALMRLGIDPTTVANIVNQQDTAALARLVTQADAGAAPTPAQTGSNPAQAGTTSNPPGTWIGQGPEPTPAGARSVADGRTITQAQAQRAAAGGYDALTPDNLKRALRAFRNKLKNLRREDESRLGNRYVTSGRQSTITAIQPPDEYPGPVWEKLVELKRLNRAGRGLFELPEDTARRPRT